MDDAEFRGHLQRLKAACNGADIAIEMGLRRRGSRFFCPSCQPDGGKSPDLVIKDAGFTCFKCGAAGDIIDLIVLAGQMTTAEAMLAAGRPPFAIPSITFPESASCGPF